MRGEDYEFARQTLLSSSFTTFNKSAQRFLEVCSGYGPARKAVQEIPTREVKYEEVRDTLEKREDPCPADASEQVSFCYALLGEVAKGGEDAAHLLGHIMTGCSGADDGLDAYVAFQCK